jgi:hypothetical protein
MPPCARWAIRPYLGSGILPVLNRWAGAYVGGLGCREVCISPGPRSRALPRPARRPCNRRSAAPGAPVSLMRKMLRRCQGRRCCGNYSRVLEVEDGAQARRLRRRSRCRSGRCGRGGSRGTRRRRRWPAGRESTGGLGPGRWRTHVSRGSREVLAAHPAMPPAAGLHGAGSRSQSGGRDGNEDNRRPRRRP